MSCFPPRLSPLCCRSPATRRLTRKPRRPRSRLQSRSNSPTPQHRRRQRTAKTRARCLLRPKTGFQLWLEENRKIIMADNPDLDETEVIKEAMGRFRTLSADERRSWTERAKGQTGDAADVRKRKRADGGAEDETAESDSESSSRKKKALDASSKLSAFAFSKN
uniref:WD repeat and HMG-box DNA-binding protein 1 n=1 Tax=Fundulus heteroclitus TaxID=8078 RepID=A0A3Q2P6P1_FUNHE